MLGMYISIMFFELFYLHNICRFGAAITKQSLRYLPESFDNEIFNPLCFIRHIDSSKPPSTWKNENVSMCVFIHVILPATL